MCLINYYADFNTADKIIDEVFSVKFVYCWLFVRFIYLVYLSYLV